MPPEVDLHPPFNITRFSHVAFEVAEAPGCRRLVFRVLSEDDLDRLQVGLSDRSVVVG